MEKTNNRIALSKNNEPLDCRFETSIDLKFTLSECRFHRFEVKY